MQVLSWDAFIAGPPLGSAISATIGVFDGVHIGHRRLISRVTEERRLGPTIAFTFRENPKKILRPQSYHGDLASLPQKLETLESLGLDLVVLIDFSGNFSKLAGKDFLSLVWDRGHPSFLAVGADFRCGSGLDTGVAEIRAFYEPHGTRVEILEPVRAHGHVVSSSRVRLLLREGLIEEAATLLGRPYEIDLRGWPAATKDGSCWIYRLPGDHVLPPPGSYLVETAGGGTRREAFLDIGPGEAELRCQSGDCLPERITFKRLYKETKR